MRLMRWVRCLALAGPIATVAAGEAAAVCIAPVWSFDKPRITSASATGYTVEVEWTLRIDDELGELGDFCLQWREYESGSSGLGYDYAGVGPWRDDLEQCTGSSEMSGDVSVSGCRTWRCQLRVKAVYQRTDGSLLGDRCPEWHTEWSSPYSVAIPDNDSHRRR